MEPLANLLPGLLEKLRSPEAQKKSRILNEWPSIAGPKLAAKTKPSLSASGDLVVWVGQSALAYEIHQKYRASLLKRAQAALGETEVKTVRIRVGQLRS